MKKFIWHLILNIASIIFLICLSFGIESFIPLIGILAISYLIYNSVITFKNEISLKVQNTACLRCEKDFNRSVNNIYDEHIFSITHELRSPLAVIDSAIYNQRHTIKTLYNSLSYEDKYKYKELFIDSKQKMIFIKNQVDIIESFISSLVEHSSYVTNKKEKIINLHNYLISILINSYSYSRSMKVFSISNICFSDIVGDDFKNVNCILNPHNLTRIFVNLMTNSADAINAIYQYKKHINKNYEPFIKISCIKSKNEKNNICLNKDFLRVNGSFDDCQPFYILIEDNGPGISDNNIKKIFKYGFSTKKHTDEDSDIVSKHHGIGLNVVLKLASESDIKVYIKTTCDGTIIALGIPFVIYDKNVPTEFSENSKMLYEKYVVEEISNNNEYIEYETLYQKLKEDEENKKSKTNIKCLDLEKL